MNERTIPVYVFGLSLLISVGILVSVMDIIAFDSTWTWLVIGWALTVNFSLIMVAYWVYDDHQNVQYSRESVSSRIEKLESIVDDNFQLVVDRLDKLEGNKEKTKFRV